MDAVEEEEVDGDDNVACDSGVVDGEECDDDVDGLPDELEYLLEDECKTCQRLVVKGKSTNISNQQTINIPTASTSFFGYQKLIYPRSR